MLTGPEFVTRKLLDKLGMTTKDIDLWELNEAFAAVVLRWVQALDLDPEKVNVNGGAIAMGHPLGATGAMILGAMVDELERSDKERALINLCVGRRHGHGHGDRAGELGRAPRSREQRNAMTEGRRRASPLRLAPSARYR